MAEEPVYNLLQAIDPSKIKVPISERFSKLTLSSNKKQKPEAVKEQEDVRQKRDSASRNILKQLSQQSDHNTSSSPPQHMNPLLRSDSSSKDHSDDHRDNKSHLGEYYETTMDSLNVTEDESEISLEMTPLDIDSLSQKVSALTVVCRQEVSLSSNSMDTLNEVTQLVSTESQRSSMGEIQKFHNIEQIPLKIYKREVVALSSASSSTGQEEQAYEITDDEDEVLQHENTNQSDKQATDEDEYEDEDEEDEVITISDSSESARAEEQTEMGVSTLRTIQEVGERTIREFREQLQLPLPTLSPQKMERVAAFLRDVSMEQRNRAENGFCDAEDSICNHSLPSETLEKAKVLTIADTESMTPEDDEKEETPEAIRERQRRLKALDEIEEQEDYKDKAKRMAEAETQDNSIVNNKTNLEKTPQNRERRLVSADTVENSPISDIELDSSIALQVTPTPRRNVEDYMYGETEENTQLTQIPACKTPIDAKTPQTIKRNNNDVRRHVGKDNRDVELSYFSPKTQKTPKSDRKSHIKRIESAETEPNTFVTDESPKTQKTPKSDRKSNIKRIESAETEPNTFVTDESPNKSKFLNTPQSSKRTQNDVRWIAMNENEENTEMPTTSRKLPYSPKSPRRAERRLVSADTEENTMSDLQLSNSITSYNSPPENDERRLALDDTEANTHLNISVTPEKYYENVILSVPSSPVYKTPQKNHLHYSNRSLNSVKSSSTEDQCNESAPEHSITILETDDEESVNKSQSLSKSPQAHDNNKLSSSLHNNEYDDDAESQSSSMSQIRMSMANINISAKINIKITIPDSTETSEDDDSRNSQQCSNTNSLPQSNSQGKQLSSPKINGDYRSAQKSDQYSSPVVDEKKVGRPDYEEIILDSDKSDVEDDNFVDTAAKLLTQLYGNSWQTPDVLRTLKKTNDSNGDMKVRTTSKVTKRRAKDKEVKNDTSKVVEDSMLGDFSMFRRNIVKTNFLDSTRLYTPNTKSTNKGFKNINECHTEPRNIRKGPEKNSQFGVPQTESRRKPTKTPMAKISANQIRSQNEKWRQLLDDDSGSECNNASDDDDADKSDDKSWHGSSPESDDSDFVISPEKPKSKTTKKGRSVAESNDGDYETSITKKSKARPNRRAAIKKNVTNKSQNGTKKRNNTSADDIVYLDLSKEEVEVQENVPQSPPANHDVTFASKLNEILRTCRHEDKPKLPSSAQSSKSKRKLFTPIFGDDLEADMSGVEIEKKEYRKSDCSLNDDGLLLDNVVCPFDARGKPKKLEVFNKQLEAVKVGKPVFQLTPSPKKATTPLRRALQENGTDSVPKSKTKSEVKLRTPTTARKEVANGIVGISKTPDYKYSFLKSLDVTVSNNFCHPDARVYRDSYRTKKEDLSRILYELYNEKLFNKRLEVPITWNKKLLNTAGRCLNKKKLGIRSSVIELSEKVLTSADRLRCTLIHELCHAATWIFNGEGGHGKTWKEWAYRANVTFPELPKIGVCHQYEIEYKYTYKCTLCAAKSHAHSKSKKVENIRCSYCHGAIEIFINKKDKDGNVLPTPVKEPTGFAKFVKDNYKKYKRDDIKHADVMKLLSSEFATLKLTKTDK